MQTLNDLSFPEGDDEDDFLYGNEKSNTAHPAEVKPAVSQSESKGGKSAEEIVSNPAFTALLKSIGLDDIKLADRIKVIQLKKSYINCLFLFHHLLLVFLFI